MLAIAGRCGSAVLSPASHNSHSLGSCHAREDAMPLLISACTLSTDCGNADMTWQVTILAETEPPSRQHCRSYSPGCICLRGAGLAAVLLPPSHRAVAPHIAGQRCIQMSRQQPRWSAFPAEPRRMLAVTASAVLKVAVLCLWTRGTHVERLHACLMRAASMSSLIGPARSLEIA